MKLLLCCINTKPYLIDLRKTYEEIKFDLFNKKDKLDRWNILNGKVVGECDYEVEEITTRWGEFETEKYSELSLRENSCLTHQELCTCFGKLRNMYGGSKHCGQAIHIKNLHIFDEPKELSNYYKQFTTHTLIGIDKPPKNMMYAYEYEERNNEDYYNLNVLASFRPKQLCKILNGECTTIIKKNVLKEML